MALLWSRRTAKCFEQEVPGSDVMVRTAEKHNLKGRGCVTLEYWTLSFHHHRR